MMLNDVVYIIVCNKMQYLLILKEPLRQQFVRDFKKNIEVLIAFRMLTYKPISGRFVRMFPDILSRHTNRSNFDIADEVYSLPSICEECLFQPIFVPFCLCRLKPISNKPFVISIEPLH